MGESGVGGTSANWNMLGTTSKRDKELWEERRKKYAEARERGEDPGAEAREEYERWYREERVPPWQERMLDKVSKKLHKSKKEPEEGKNDEGKVKTSEDSERPS